MVSIVAVDSEDSYFVVPLRLVQLKFSTSSSATHRPTKSPVKVELSQPLQKQSTWTTDRGQSGDEIVPIAKPPLSPKAQALALAPSTEQEMIRLYLETDQTFEEIGQAVGLSHQKVASRLKQLLPHNVFEENNTRRAQTNPRAHRVTGEPKGRPPVYTEDQRLEILRLYRETDYSIAKISAEIKLDDTLVFRLVRAGLSLDEYDQHLKRRKAKRGARGGARATQQPTTSTPEAQVTSPPPAPTPTPPAPDLDAATVKAIKSYKNKLFSGAVAKKFGVDATVVLKIWGR
jgi:transposase-like protein